MQPSFRLWRSCSKHRAAFSSLAKDAPFPQTAIAALSAAGASKQLAKLLDSACASWGARSTAAHMELMLAHMHCHTIAPSSASMQRLAWLAAHRPVDRHSSVWSAALLLLGTARSVLTCTPQPMSPAAVRSILSAAQTALRQASEGAPAAALLPAAATLSLLSSAAALGNTAQLLPPSAAILQSPWAQQSIQAACSRVLRFALQPASAEAADGPARLLAHSIAGNHARAAVLAQEALQAPYTDAAALDASVATCVLLRQHFSPSTSAPQGCDVESSPAPAVQAAGAFWADALQRIRPGQLHAVHARAVAWAVLHVALLLPPAMGCALVAQLRGSGCVGGRGGDSAGAAMLQLWEQDLRAAVAEGGLLPPLLPQGLHVGTRSIALWLQQQGGGGAVSAGHAQAVLGSWPDPLLGLQVQIGFGRVDEWGGEGGWAPASVWQQRWLCSMPAGGGVAWPPPYPSTHSHAASTPTLAREPSKHHAAELGGGLGTGAAAALSSWQFDMWLGFGDAGDMLVQAAQRVAKRMKAPQPAVSEEYVVSSAVDALGGADPPSVAAEWQSVLHAADEGILPASATAALRRLQNHQLSAVQGGQR